MNAIIWSCVYIFQNNPLYNGKFSNMGKTLPRVKGICGKTGIQEKGDERLKIQELEVRPECLRASEYRKKPAVWNGRSGII